jgi:hypothetical protein
MTFLRGCIRMESLALSRVELTTGLFLLFGLLSRGASLSGIAILLVATAAQAHVMLSGDLVPCGCISVQSEEPIGPLTIARTAVLLCMAILVYAFETFWRPFVKERIAGATRRTTTNSLQALSGG